jgi:F0F1-type ATP synthase membrane subunit b/b'
MSKLGIDWRMLIAQLISFSIVFFVLWKLAYKPIFNMLEIRRQKIAESLANAGAARQNRDRPPGGVVPGR